MRVGHAGSEDDGLLPVLGHVENKLAAAIIANGVT
jgi:hypothetical protein